MERSRPVTVLVLMLISGTSFIALCSSVDNTSADSEPLHTMDSTPPVAEAGSDKTVNENETVVFDGSSSSDDVGIVNYTWSYLRPRAIADQKNLSMLPFPVTDAVFDPIRPYVYVSDKENNKVHFVNLETGSIEKEFDVSLPPESVAINPNASNLFVALLTRDHDTYWEDGTHEGYIAKFDLEQQVKETEFHITEDPYDMVATSDEFLVVSSGSGGNTYLRVFWTRNGMQTGITTGVYERTRLTLHPSESVVYGANDYSSYGLRRYTYTPGGIRYDWGKGSTVSNAWTSPYGDTIVTGSGRILAVGDTKETDMIFLKRLTGRSITDLAFDTTTQTLFAAGGYWDSLSPIVSYYDPESNYTYLGHQSFELNARFIGTQGHWVYGLLDNGSSTQISALPHPKTTFFGEVTQHTFPGPGLYTVTLTVRDASGKFHSDTMNVTVLDTTSPVAEAGDEWTAIQGQEVRFDGSGSTDNIGVVNYTWTFTDVESQTLYKTYPRYSFKYVGTYNITLTVRDAVGLIDTDWLIVNVIPIPLVMHENVAKGFRIGIPPDWDVEIEKEVEGMGLADLVAYGPYVDLAQTNVVIASETRSVRETDSFLIAEAEEMIDELTKEMGVLELVRGPEIVDTANSRAAVFEVEYRQVSYVGQRVALVANERQGRIWAIIITTSIFYNNTMSITYDEVIKSFEVVEPPLLSTPIGQSLVGAAISILAGILAGVVFYFWKRRQDSLEMENQPQTQQEMPTETSTQSPLPPTIPLCNNCGAQLVSPYNFCTKCGSRSP